MTSRAVKNDTDTQSGKQEQAGKHNKSKIIITQQIIAQVREGRAKSKSHTARRANETQSLGKALVPKPLACQDGEHDGFKRHRNVLCKISNEFIAAIHYFLLGGYTGMCINFASCFTNGVYWYRNKKGKSTLIFQILFGAMFVCLGLLSWHGPISIFVILAKIVSSVSLGINKPRVIRILNLISNPCWLVYNIYMGSIAGIISDTLVIASVLIAVIRLDIIKRERPDAPPSQTEP